MEKSATEERPVEEWVDWLTHYLQILKWPSIHKGQTQQATKLVDAFSQELVTLSKSTLIVPKMDFNTMLDYLHTLCASHYVDSGNPKAPIHFISLDEASGYASDALWLMGCDQSRWPVKKAVYPMLSGPLRQHIGDPYFDDAGHTRYAILKIKQLKSQAPLAYFSFNQDHDLDTQTISPLFGEDLHIQALAKPMSAEPIFLINSSYHQPIDIKPTSATSQHLADHIQCPFKAFAIHYLGVKRSIRPHIGFDARERGIMMHQALYHFWQQMQSHERLIQSDSALKTQMIQRAAHYALKPFSAQRQDLNKEFINQATIRLIAQIHAWLQVEADRPPFSIYALEHSLEVTLHNVKFRMRADRIDRLADGQLILIDYKTGLILHSSQDWLSTPPSEVQLPLYALASEQAVSGIMIAQLQGPVKRFHGLTATPYDLPGVTTIEKKNPNLTWTLLSEQWASSLATLTASWLSDDRSPRPLDPRRCHQCHIKYLCRIPQQV